MHVAVHLTPESAIRTGINPRKYVGFFSLRSWTELDVLRTTVVYVHSKLMIVDDRIVIVGSGMAYGPRPVRTTKRGTVGLISLIRAL